MPIALHTWKSKESQSIARNVKWTRVGSGFDNQTKQKLVLPRLSLEQRQPKSTLEVPLHKPETESNKEEGESKSFHICFHVWINNIGLWLLSFPDYWNNKNLKIIKKKRVVSAFKDHFNTKTTTIHTHHHNSPDLSVQIYCLHQPKVAQAEYTKSLSSSSKQLRR